MSAEMSVGQKPLIDSSVEWRAEVDELLQKHKKELDDLQNSRHIQEVMYSAQELGNVRSFTLRNLDKNAKKLFNLANGIVDGVKKEPKLTIPLEIEMDSYLEAASRLGDTRPGEFIKNIFKRMMVGTSRRSNVVHLRSLWLRDLTDTIRFTGGIWLSDEDNRSGGSFDIDFDAPHKSLGPININFHNNIYSTDFLSKQFDDLILSEKTIVVATLFYATDQAITEALKKF